MRNELMLLRQAMARAGVDAYVVPTDDFHGSEYVGDYFKCRAWVSGFTGSAGTLVVTADRAGLWTDGRYFLQAGTQLSGSGIDLMKMGEAGVPKVPQWLREHLTAGQTLGFDGRTMTAGTGRELEAAAASAGAKVKFDLDLVGEVWADRPPLPGEGVWALPLQYTGRTRGEKLKNLRQSMEEAGADLHVLTAPEDICWLMNLRGGDVASVPVVLSFLTVTADRAVWYLDENKLAPFLKKGLAGDGVELRPYLSLFDDVRAVPAGTRVLLDPARVSYAIRRSLPEGVTVIEARNPTELPKAIKTQAEQEGMRQAHIKDGVALCKFMKWVKEQVGAVPMTEISCAEKLEGLRKQQDYYLEPSFDPIFGYGSNGAIIHYSATEETNAEVRPEGFLLSDTGGHYLEGTTDVTRTYALGPLTEEMRHHYTLVLRSHLALANARFKAGTPGAALDMLARKPFWEEGLDYNHGTGHGVGSLLSVHEGPQNINYHGEKSTVAFAPGMVTSDEPGLYLPGKYGIRLENLLLCVEKEQTEFGAFLGFEYLTLCPFDLDAVNLSELSDLEKQQLDAYHALVYEKISPFLCEKGRAWLAHATRKVS